VRGPLVKTEQDSSVSIENLTPVVMSRRRFGLTEERLIPFEAARHVTDADDCPYAFHVFGVGPNDVT